MREFNFRKGESARLERFVSEADVIKMAELSCDYNPLHVDSEYAKNTRFGRRIAHGLFCASMVSAILGNDLPGLGTIILWENMRFQLPVYIGDTILAQVCIEEVRPEKRRVRLSFFCRNQDGQVVMSGDTEVMVD